MELLWALLLPLFQRRIVKAAAHGERHTHLLRTNTTAGSDLLEKVSYLHKQEPWLSSREGDLILLHFKPTESHKANTLSSKQNAALEKNTLNLWANTSDGYVINIFWIKNCLLFSNPVLLLKVDCVQIIRPKLTFLINLALNPD